MGETEHDALSEIVSAALSLFPDLDYLAPGGVLVVRESRSSIDRLRIQLPPGQYLHLQSLDVAAVGVADIASMATVRVSSWHKEFGAKFDPARLFDFDSPSGTVVHTEADEPAWLEVSFARPLDITSVRLRNVATPTAVRARGITLLAGSPGQPLSSLYDGAERARQLTEALTALVAHSVDAIDDDTSALLPIAAKTLTGDYPEARAAFEKLSVADDAGLRYKRVINTTVLNARSLEWTVHGPQRSFRFWTAREKTDYIRFTATVADDLRELSPHACFGFGAALAVVRDGDLIPHDDDLDLIIGFENHEAATLPQALRRVEEFLRARDYTVAGNFSAHRHVSVPGRKKVDVFVGLFEDDTISWYPGARGSLTRQMMFPTSEGTLLGITCPLPRNPLVYLEKVYGAGWRHPDPGFKHTWDRSAYADLVRARTN